MPRYNIRGVMVEFPFDAYQCQLIYMERVIDALQNGQNALLESPTGTGKTLCLLCATLAWQEATRTKIELGEDPSEKDLEMAEKSGFTTIIYASRTHSQLSQVISELKRTSYQPKTTILGSRNQMCVNPEVKNLKGAAQAQKCHHLVQHDSCVYYRGMKTIQASKAKRAGLPNVVDIEDLVSLENRGCCPYYFAREIQNEAAVVFMPYNYLIDPVARRGLSVDFSRSVVILDEAHNLESVCSDSASFEITTKQLTACMGELQKFVDDCGKPAEEFITILDGNENEVDVVMVIKLKCSSGRRPNEDMGVCARFGYFDCVDQVVLKQGGVVLPGIYIYDVLEKSLITPATAQDVVTRLEKVIDTLIERGGAYSHLTEFVRCLQILFKVDDKGQSVQLPKQPFDKAEINKHHRVHIDKLEKDVRWGNINAREERKLSFWCFSPGIAMKELKRLRVKSILLTSGTLSPLESFASELALDFPVRLENPHVIEDWQVWVGVITRGPDNTPLNYSFDNRQNKTYLNSLGNTVLNVCRNVPDGVLVFFPSYSALSSCIQAWKTPPQGATESIWEGICRLKHPIEEPKSNDLCKTAIKDFYEKIKEPPVERGKKGAVFFAVCRGKVSEGLDFADKNGRAVIITGQPFPSILDPKVKQKQKYLDDLKSSDPTNTLHISGSQWYKQCASRAVNQAVGRVIRHRFDHGAIILADERFASSKGSLSSWLRSHFTVHDKFGQALSSLKKFFNVIQTKSKTIETKTSLQGCITDELSRVNAARAQTFLEQKKHNEQLVLEKNKQAEAKKSATTQEALEKESLEYLKEVKGALGDEYDKFRKALKEFRSNRSTEYLFSQIFPLFGGNASREGVLRRFVNFVPDKDKEKFKQLVAEDVQKRKDEEQKKKRERFLDNLPSPEEPKPKKIKTEEAITTETEEIKLSSASPFTKPKPKQYDLVTGKLISKGPAPPRFPSGDKTGLPRFQAPRKIETSTVAVGQAPILNPSPKVDNTSTPANPPTSRCPVCLEVRKNPHTAKCGHSCCLDCWNNLLSLQGANNECPICKNPVRKKHLRPVFD